MFRRCAKVFIGDEEMVREIFIDARQPIDDAISKIAAVFDEAGWDILVQESRAVVVKSPESANGNYLRVKWSAAEDERRDSEAGGAFKWGVLVAIGRENSDSAPGWTENFASTIFHGGAYTFVISPTSFVLLPPETQTHRFSYGTWCTLLYPIIPTYVRNQGNKVPFLFMGDRAMGAYERQFLHTQNYAPVFLLHFPNGEQTNSVAVMHASLGRKFIFQRDRYQYIIPFSVFDSDGVYLTPVLSAPHWFVEINPLTQTYLPTLQSVGIGDFLVPKMVLRAIKVVPCGLLPPDGAKLLSVVS